MECGECGFDWWGDEATARGIVGEAADRFRQAFKMAGAAPLGPMGGTWSPEQYLWHVVDVLRFGTERLWVLALDPGAGMMAWDADEMAHVRRRSSHSVPVGIQALGVAAEGWLAAARQAPLDVTSPHPELGPMDRLASIRRNAHEVVHHVLDVRRGLPG